MRQLVYPLKLVLTLENNSEAWMLKDWLLFKNNYTVRVWTKRRNKAILFDTKRSIEKLVETTPGLRGLNILSIEKDF